MNFYGDTLAKYLINKKNVDIFNSNKIIFNNLISIYLLYSFIYLLVYSIYLYNQFFFILSNNIIYIKTLL